MKLKRSELSATDFDEWRDDRRPDHQVERGKRYGNNRKLKAALKVEERQRDRAKNKRQVEVDDGYPC